VAPRFHTVDGGDGALWVAVGVTRMDGIHDIGGMDGVGPVDVDEDGDVFHHQWEGRVLATLVTLFARGEFNDHEFRHARERVRPHPYLASSYYELMLRGIETLLVESGTLEEAAIDERAAAVAADEAARSERADEALAERVREFVDHGGDGPHPVESPSFAVGDRVVVANDHPQGHTRCPDYSRRARGVVTDVYGTFEVADALAHGREAAEPVYNVRFAASELWGRDGDHEPGDAVRLDMWERYLEPVADGGRDTGAEGGETA
jgi:nitrile hydratase